MRHVNNTPKSLQPLALPEGFRAGDFNQADRFIRQCPHYRPSPLHRLDRLAEAFGIGQLSLKDESRRFGLRSFKGLGGPYAVIMMAWQRLKRDGQGALAPNDLLPAAEGVRAAGDPRPARQLTVACATAGNHGQAVAAGARLIGARCRVFVPATTEAARIEAIQAQGAEVVRVEALYDETVAEARSRAEEAEWLFVPDSSLHGDRESARLVMLAYGVILHEAVEEMERHSLAMPTHLFLQGGVGGLAGGLAAWARRKWGEQRPRIVVVEPESADCLMQSALAGGPSPSAAEPDTNLRGMDCAQPSPLAWAALASSADHFLTVDDHACQQMVTGLNRHNPAIRTSPSGAAGITPLAALAEDEALRQALGLDAQSHALGILTEGAI